MCTYMYSFKEVFPTHKVSMLWPTAHVKLRGLNWERENKLYRVGTCSVQENSYVHKTLLWSPGLHAHTYIHSFMKKNLLIHTYNIESTHKSKYSFFDEAE